MKELSKLINIIREEKVIFDFNLAMLYGIETRALKQAVNRNLSRFPDEFMFLLTEQEIRSLISQNVISSYKTLGRRPPMAFTEPGVAMLSSVLRSKKAIEINILIMRIFILIRKSFEMNNNLELKFKIIERELADHSIQLEQLFTLLSKMNKDGVNQHNRIGFKTD